MSSNWFHLTKYTDFLDLSTPLRFGRDDKKIFTHNAFYSVGGVQRVKKVLEKKK